ncbi:MAG: ABC transporter substrate-binding protein [Bradyrhizobiaceae bacterium]|nr:ABC transporter substrate-binding protein [Bradyrhizobiaceae bacterium]
MIRAICTAAIFVCATSVLAAAEPLTVKIAYLGRADRVQTISLVEMPAANNGIAGAQLAVDDNNTTGKFLNESFTIEDVQLKDEDDPAAAITQIADRGIGFVVTDLPGDMLLKAADAARARSLILFNAGAIDDRLREEDCRATVIHTAPTRAMLADGLAQYLVWKHWTRWLLVVGSHAPDKLYADALRRSANRFGAKIVQERVFQDTGGARRTDSGLVQVQSQIPLFTQSAPEYDVLVAADESQVFADYLPYRTRDPRPVAGSGGLMPTSWDASLDQWGAIQLQNRFQHKFSRHMTALDMQAWTAVRMIGEALDRVKSADAKTILDYIKGPDFSLAAFKGRKLTVRDWDLQLRQPILLTDGRTVVSVSPQEGFLHQFSELDTLGIDRPETKCQLK